MWSPFLKTFLDKIQNDFFLNVKFWGFIRPSTLKTVFFYGFGSKYCSSLPELSPEKNILWLDQYRRRNTNIRDDMSVLRLDFHRSSRGSLHANILDPTGGNWRWISLFYCHLYTHWQHLIVKTSVANAGNIFYYNSIKIPSFRIHLTSKQYLHFLMATSL